jgi:hypothetical protein
MHRETCCASGESTTTGRSRAAGHELEVTKRELDAAMPLALHKRGVQQFANSDAFHAPPASSKSATGNDSRQARRHAQYGLHVAFGA